MADRYVVGIDCGTQSAKVEIFDPSGRSVSFGRQPLRPVASPSPGVAVHPDDDLWSAIGSATRAAMETFPGKKDEIAAVGLCPIRCCKAFLRSDGSLLEPVVSWMDKRAYQPYVPLDPSFVYATTASGYLAHRLTGQFKDTAANNVLLQWPIDPRSWQWSTDPAVRAEFRLEPEQLFELQQPGEVIGGITSAAAEMTGLAAGTPVVATANDKAVEMLGAGPIGDSTVLISLGTYITAMTHGDRYHLSPSTFWTNFASMPGRYLYESVGVRGGMSTVTWFLNLLGPEFAAEANQRGKSREQLLENEAVQVDPGSDGLFTALDWLAPTDKPFR